MRYVWPMLFWPVAVAILLIAVAIWPTQSTSTRPIGAAAAATGRQSSGPPPAPSSSAPCEVGGYPLETAQSVNASTLLNLAQDPKCPDPAAAILLAAAIKASDLRNIAPGQGTLDGVGILQLRPSQGWGSEGQLSDVRTSAGKFLDALVQRPGWQTAPVASTVQAILELGRRIGAGSRGTCDRQRAGSRTRNPSGCSATSSGDL